VADHGLPVLYALFLWWFSTGVILYLDGLPRRTFRWSMLGGTVLALGALWGMAATRNDTSVIGAYAGFTYGLLIWGWHEISFLMGMVTGPRRTACPEACRGWRHLGHAIQAILWHELAIAATAVLMVALTWGAENQVATWTFMVLWVMRLSAKLNVYLGVPNLTDEFLPEHLAYLKSFMRKRPMNALFPLSVTAGTVVTTQLVGHALAGGEGSFEATAYTFAAVLLALAILEHWFLVLPLPDAALWSWALRSRSPEPTDERSNGLSAEAPLPTYAALSAIGRRT
jgi:putative photosynthetic complex assembly protein 2